MLRAKPGGDAGVGTVAVVQGKEQQWQELPKMRGTGTHRCPQGLGTRAGRQEPIQIPHYNKRAVGQCRFKATQRNLAVKQNSRSKHMP